MDRDGSWSGLTPAWQQCFRLAWESFRNGSNPVGSVITDAAGTIVAAGRNRGAESRGDGNLLGGTLIAHAEINALAQMPPGDYPDHVLWSTLEPCFLCSAAAMHSHIGRVRFAAADPLMAGVDRLPTLNDWASKRWPERDGPAGGPLGKLAGMLALTWELDRGSTVVPAAYAQSDPGILDLARRMGRRLRERAHMPIEAVAEEFWPELG